jgi:kynureninase
LTREPPSSEQRALTHELVPPADLAYWQERAGRADEQDPLGAWRDQFEPLPPDVVAYLDGNSLGRIPKGVTEAMQRFLRDQWGGRLIRGWGEGWMDLPAALGDRLAKAALGAAPGQVVVGESTTVLLYKLARAALEARPGRRTILVDTDNFPTDRYLAEGIARERGCRLRWVTTDPESGLTAEQVAANLDDDVALVVASHVSYRSAWLADMQAVTALAHDAGALVLWDVSHSVGSVPIRLDDLEVDLAAGCTYKYLNGGPGSPAFAYVRSELQEVLRQPIWGWLGSAEPFAMGPGYVPAPGVKSMLSGTPHVVSMIALGVALGHLEQAGIEAVREKSVALTSFAVELADAWLAGEAVQVASPRDPDRRGGHVTLRRADFESVKDRLWSRGVIPDFRFPDGIRLGLAPLSTSFAELLQAMVIFYDEVRRR